MATANSSDVKLTRKDFVSDQDVRWCPGCGDYAILAQVQKVLPELGIPREKFVFISPVTAEISTLYVPAEDVV